MATELITIQWTEILLDKEITNDLDIAIFQGLYSFDGHKAPASQIGLILGKKGKSPQSSLNAEIGRYAKRIAKEYDIRLVTRPDGTQSTWNLFFNGWTEKPFFIWQLKPNLSEALEETGLTGEEQYPEEIRIDEYAILAEGLKRTITVNTFERNPKARQKCIAHWTAVCSVCDFDFEKEYGDLGKGFIHVHHLIPVSNIGRTYQVDPINDLRPICPNCHSMIHRTNPPLTIEELKKEKNKARP